MSSTISVLRHVPLGIASAAIALASITVNSTAQAASVIHFETGPLGSQPNGFSAVGFPDVTFNDTNGQDLSVGDFGRRGNGISLSIFDNSDRSGLEILFASPAQFLSFSYGNDELFSDPQTVDIALTLFLDSIQVGQAVGIPNFDGVMNQRLSFSGAVFNRATIFYRAADTNPSALIEVVDNITYEPATAIPTPALLPGLIGMGVAALRKRKGEALAEESEQA